MLLMNLSPLDGLTGRIVTPLDPEYNQARQEWNRTIQKFPLLIVYCQNKYDVSNAVLWSVKNRVPLRIRSGGHNYEGYSVGNAVIVIDISEMNYLELAEEKNLLRVEGGATNSQIYNFVSSRGYPFPGGTCPTVGVSGLATGGGWGLSCRNFGLTCDSLLELEMVNYQGKIIRADNFHNADLFWACRGAGGGNFGVIVSMTFRLPPKVGYVTFLELYYPQAGQQNQALFLETWQDWLRCADKEITMIANIYNTSEEGLSVFARGLFYGRPEEALAIIQPFLDIGMQIYTLEFLSFWAAINKIGEVYPASEKFKTSGRFVIRNLDSDESIDVVSLIQDRPLGSVLTSVNLYALGGMVAQTDRDDTAFFYRDAKYIIGLQTVWEDDRFAGDNRKWFEPRFRYLSSVTDGSYINFPNIDQPCYLEEYYGLHADELRKIKLKYDPYNIFRFPQSIRWD